MAIKIAGTEVINDNKRVLNNESLPDVRPSLLLDFANSKTLDPRITFTRGSTATYWDGKTTAKAEENLLAYSQQFDNSYWTKIRANVTANATTAPDGTTTAESFTQQSGQTNFGRLFRVNFIPSATTGDDYTFSVYAKSNGKNFVILGDAYFKASNYNYTWFNLSTGAVGTTDPDHTASITDVGNGWYRCSITVTASSAVSGNLEVSINLADTDGSTTVTDDQQGIYVWGAQVEQRSSATAYTATTTSPIVKYQPVLQTAASGEARFDHDPVTGESKGLLIEEARTNLETNSVYSGNNNVIITTDATTAPDGTQTGILIQENTSNALHRGTGTTLLPAASTRYTFSVYIKNYEESPNERYMYLNLGSTIGAAIGLDLSTMTINTTNGGGSPVSSIEEVGNGWYRLILTGTSSASPTSNNAWYTFRTSAGTGDQTYTGDGFSGFYIWGAQFEQGSFPTSYIPTSGSTVTRVKEEASFTYANSGFNQQETTIYAEVTMDHEMANTYPRILDVPDSFIIAGAEASDYIYFQSNLSTYPTVNGDANSFGIGTHKIAASFENHVGFSLSVDGNVNTASGEGFYIPSPEGQPFYLIGTTSNNRYLGGTMKKFAIYPKRLPNATLQAMTEA